MRKLNLSNQNPARFMSGTSIAALSLLKTLPLGKVLDVACGEGALAWELNRMGFEVSCCDIDVDLFKLKDIEIKAANLNRDMLPYQDECFDYVVCMGALHRLYDIDHALGEMKRVLKSEGQLVVGVINFSNILRRMRFLVKGSIARSLDDPRFVQVTSDPEANFRHPLLLSRIQNALLRQGMTAERIMATRVSKRTLFFLPLVGAIALYGFLRKLFWSMELIHRSSFLPQVLLGGKYLIILVGKTKAD